MSLPSSRRPSGEVPSVITTRRTLSGHHPAAPRRSPSGEMGAVSTGQPSSGEFRSANPEGDAYRPLIELGRGGMARVYLAEKNTRGLRRLVVLKVLEPTLATDPEMRSAFRREAEVCARLNHPNIVQVFEVVEESASPIMVMEYVEGVSLSQVVARTENRLPMRLHVHVLMQVLAGLHYFHDLRDEDGQALHAVHRDVSPQNVLVMHEGAAKVLDFGIAKLHGPDDADATRAGIIKGKLSYMPPEQLLGDTTIDRRADIFSVGVMLWEAFARRRLWEGYDQQAMMKALMNGTIPAIRDICSWVSKDMEAVITRATAVERGQRFRTALEMQVALEECMPELGGAVQQREIAAFMEAEFGEWRRERQKLVDAEVRKPALQLDSVLEVSEIEEIAIEGEYPENELHSRTGAAPFRERSPLVYVLAGAGLLGLAGLSWFYLRTAGVGREAEVAAAPVKRQIRLQLAASPVEAQIFLEGKPLGENPWHGDLEASTRSARVEVRAPGYETSERDVSLSADADFSFRLKPLAEPKPEATEEPARGKSEGKRAPRGVGRVVAPPASQRAPAAPAPAARNCSPPYVLDADGVKTYKPECL